MEFEVVEESGLLFGFGGHKPDFQPLEGADEDEFSERDSLLERRHGDPLPSHY